MAAAKGPAPKDFQFRRLQKPEELRSAEELARSVGLSEEPAPTMLQRAMQDNGGLVIGAFAEIYLAGFTSGFLGWDGEKLFHYAYQTAVRPEYQNHRLGFRLMLQVRDEMLRQGLEEVRWTFDPLVSRNAFLFVRRLGAVPDRYHVHYYGRIGPDGGHDTESDRLRAIWRVGDPGVAARLEGKPLDAAADARRFAEGQAIVETEVDENGLRTPSAVQEPSAATAHLEIPFDLALIGEHAPKSLRSWRHAVRDAFRAAFDTGYVVDDFAVVTAGHERRSVYFLRKKDPAPAAA